MSNRRLRPKISLLLLSLIAPFFLVSVGAESAVTVHPDGRVLFTGDTARLSVGYATGGYFHGEMAGVLHETNQYSLLGEGWFSRSSGGAKISYHLLSGDTVHKYFVAHDQNQTRDRKVTFGYGLEKESWFGNVNLSKGLTDRRLIDKSDQVNVFQESGTVNNAPYVDTVTRTTTTRIYEKAYDYGIGLRAGRYYNDKAIRLTTGFDYEWGRSNARQSTLSLVAEKMFVGTPHSVALQLDQRQKSGDVEIVRNETRALVSYRYSFGSTPNTQPERLYRMVPSKQAQATPAVVMSEPTVIPARTEKKWVKTKASMNGDAFFEFDSAKLTPLARTELDRIVTLLKANGREGDVRIVGHTCDIGPDKANDKLSVKRAEAVRDYLVAASAFSRDDSLVEGKGKREPKYPATPESREKNRRVELEFFSFVEKEEVTEIPAQVIPGKPIPVPEQPVTYEREYVDQPIAWTKRAMRVAALHKRTVDVYRSKEETQVETRTRAMVNRAPTAVDDAFSVASGSSMALGVLVNDSDPDAGDTLSLASVGSARGQIRIEGRQLMYTAPADFIGEDRFSYTIRDSSGVSSTANVVITVTKANLAPIARDDFFWVNAREPTRLLVLANDTDPDGDPLVIVSVSQPVGQKGTVRIVGSEIVFTPFAPFWGDTFTYTISDGKGSQSTATVQLIDP
jgi:outer membrane protein OmpA-like peptidoglycan-associated protein